MAKDKKRGLIIVSNRLPLSLQKIDDSFESSLSSGGLITALSGLTFSTTFKWFGWPGISIPDPDEQKKAAESLADQGARGIFLDEQLAHAHYNGFSNSILWPILHYQFGVDFQEDYWNPYQRVNDIFAETMAHEAENEHLIWVHDYHLMLFPQLLRDHL